MSDLRSQNKYTTDAFPDRWSKQDFEFLASFLRTEFGAEFYPILRQEEEWDYHLLTPVDQEDTEQ